MVRIAIDAMGGDAAPGVNVSGALLALEREPGLNLVLVGPRDLIQRELTKHSAQESDRLQVVHCDDVISMQDHAAAVARKKRESSVHGGLRLVKDGKADAFFSAGNSGAVMAVALLELGRLPGVERPAILVRVPTAEGSTALLDVGANVDCRPSQLEQFAQMGETFCRLLDGVEKPRIGLLSNGSETHKGNELTRQAHELLVKNSSLNYVGYVEGFDLFRGVADVIVCDGFVGNVALKVAEGLADTVFRWFKSEVRKDVFGLVGMVFLQRVVKAFKRKFDYQPYGAAPLLGIDGMVWIGHGSSTDAAICNALLTVKRGVDNQLMEKMRQIGLEKGPNQ